LHKDLNTWLTNQYAAIVLMSKKICKGSLEHEDVAHYCIEKFMEHKRAEELITKGEAMRFMSGMIHRSFHSSTSPYHKLYRQSGRVHGITDKTERELEVDEPYDIEWDLIIESISGIMEDMKSDGIEQWYRVTLFEMWLKESNYSELSRITKIPRTSISQAVQECKEYIKKRMDNGDNY